MNIWTIYDHPSDHPHEYVARLFTITTDGARATGSAIVSMSLGAIRADMTRKGLTQIARHDDDDPVIVECWL